MVVIERSQVVTAHRELVEASDAVRHLLVVDDLTQDKIDEARERLARAYERAEAADNEALHV
jgi:allophanate hydrolase subunit 1